MADDDSDDRLAHLGEETLESAQMGTSHSGVSRGGEDVTDTSELGLQRLDQLVEQGATVVELVGDQESWRFGHVLVDEAQELTPMQWRMIKRRTQGGSITIVGDVAQRSSGPVLDWSELLGDTFDDVVEANLSINYRSPSEVNQVAKAILAQIAPHLSPTEAIRSSGFKPDAVTIAEGSLQALVETEKAEARDGSVAVIGWEVDLAESTVGRSVSVLTPAEAKGLEFDSVIVVEPAQIYQRNPSDLYVACTRSTGRLRFAHSSPLPDFLAGLVTPN